MSDVRIFDPTGKAEIPYVVTLSSTSDGSDPAHVASVTPAGAHVLKVDLDMPHRSYSQVNLSLNARDFVATAHITGLRTLTDPSPVFLGDVKLFDLTTQHLGSNTSIPIAESTFPYLRLHLTFEPAPGNAALLVTPSTVSGAQVPAARQAQTLFTGIAQSFLIAQRGVQTVVTFKVPAHVPVERVSFDLDPAEVSSFNRSVTVSASTTPNAPVETLAGQISQVHLTIGNQQIDQRSLSFPAVLGSNTQSPATVEVAIQNGQQSPLKLRTVRLEMRQRQICFAPTAANATLAYGSDSVQPATYDFARTFDASTSARRATLLHEHTNTFFVMPAKAPSRFQRGPAFLALTLLVVLSLLAIIGYRALHRGHQDSLRR